jgi:hypothetical protein
MGNNNPPQTQTQQRSAASNDLCHRRRQRWGGNGTRMSEYIEYFTCKSVKIKVRRMGNGEKRIEEATLA